MKHDRTYSFDLTSHASRSTAIAMFRHGMQDEDQVPYPLPPFAPRDDDEFRIRATGLTLDDTLVTTMHSVALRGEILGARDDQERHVLMHLGRRGRWRFEHSGGRRGPTSVSVAAGDYLIRDSGQGVYCTAHDASARLLVLPTSELGPLVGRDLLLGSASTPEARLLAGHLHTLDALADELTPTAARAGAAALVELVKGVIKSSVDKGEPLLAPALVQAAKDLVEARLARPDLAPATLARDLHVSVRTLHRAFTAGEESLSAYIRRRRLEEARGELLASADPPSVSEVAAHWQFTDSSHLIRSFKRQYGQTPGEYRRTRGEGARPGPAPGSTRTTSS